MRRILTILAAGTIALSACSDDTVVEPTNYVFVVMPDQAALSLTQDDSVLVGATVVDTIAGGHMYSPALTWTSDDPAVATVESADDGKWQVRAMGGGETQIHIVFQASTGPTEGIIDVSVEANPAAVFDIAESAVALYPGDTTTLGITLQDAAGNDLSHHRIDWENSADSVASLDLDGFITAVDTGTTTIIATVEGTSDTITVTVQPRPVSTITVTPDIAALHVGEAVNLSATLKAANGESLDDREITWSSLVPLVATVDSTGRVTAVGAGQTTISATSGGKTGTATIYVQ
jgi:uncharacterized protein YjdB